MDAAAELGRNPVRKHQIQPEYGDEQADGRLNPSRETKFSGPYGDRGILIFLDQLTTSRIGNLTRLIHTLLYVMTIHIPRSGIALLRMETLKDAEAYGTTILLKYFRLLIAPRHAISCCNINRQPWRGDAVALSRSKA